MTELEENIIPELDHLYHWKRYVDDTHAYIEVEYLNDVIEKLNSFDENIQFTFELEKNKCLSFLDVLIERKENGELETTIYKKETNTDLYIDWYSHAPIDWKKSTLRGLIKRALLVCSTEDKLEKELNHLKTVFCNLNNYPKHFVYQIIEDEITRNQSSTNTNNENNEDVNEEEVIQLTLPYNGQHGNQLIRKMKKRLKKLLPSNVKTSISYSAVKLSSKFRVKDKTKFEHRNDIVYLCKCPEINCKQTYIGETKRRIIERVIDHNKRDKNSHVLRHTDTEKHKRVFTDDFTILGSNYRSNFKRKISESLFIKQYKPTLNTQENSITLKLFN